MPTFITRSMMPASCGGSNLAAGRPIDFHRIVARRIVAGRDHDAATALEMAHGERQLRRAAIAVEEKDLEARSGHDLAAQLGEVARLMPRVVGNRARQQILVAGKLARHVVGQSLRTFANRAIVDRARCRSDTSCRAGRRCRRESRSRMRRRAPSTCRQRCDGRPRERTGSSVPQ